MSTAVIPQFVRRLAGVASSLLVITLLLGTMPASASAASSWSPTLLVNTESFQTIDSGDGTTNIELRFGSSTTTIKFLNASQLFEFSKGIKVLGTISGSQLTIDGNSTISGSLLIKNNLAAKGAVSGSTLSGFGLGSCSGAGQKILYNNATGKFACSTDIDTNTTYTAGQGLTLNGTSFRMNDAVTGSSLNIFGAMSGSRLTISNNANLSGTLTVKGATTLRSTLGVTSNVTTDADLTINNDAGAVDSVLTFGNATGNQTLKFLNSSQKFEFSKDLRVIGNISGSTLTVDGAITLRGVTYNAPTAQGAANTFLKNDGGGNLTWGTTAVGNGSGGILSLHPEYPNAVYFSSGSSFVGQLTMSGGTTALENSYLWTSSRSGLQNYWVSVRVRLPDSFSSWDPIKPIELRYKTGVASNANNDVKVMIRDTAGAYRVLTGGEALANTAWTTANITGPNTGGTWTPKGYVTVYVKLAANSTAGANAAVGFLNLNFETTTP